MVTKSDVPPLVWLRAFEATARLGSFTRAANELFLTQSAVSQHVRHLEEWLDTRLFIRRSRGVNLSDTGIAYLPTVQDAFQRLKTGTQDLFGSSEQSVLTIKAGVTFIHQCLLPNVAAFKREHPTIQLRLLATVWPETSEQEQDVELEIKHVADGFYDQGELLAKEVWYAMASPTLIKERGAPQPHDLLNWPLVQLIGAQANWRRWFQAADVGHDEPSASISLDVGYLAIAAATAGHGAIISSTHIAFTEITTGQLQILDGPALTGCSSHRVYMSQSAKNRPAAKKFIEWLKEIMQKRGEADI